MQSFEGAHKSGRFSIEPGVEVEGELILKGSKTTLDLFSQNFFSTHELEDDCILGALHDRTKVSLIDCITTRGPGSGSRGQDCYHFSSVFPHFVIFGNEHITAAERKITHVSFHVNDAENLFYDFDAFGKVIDAPSYIAQLVETKKIFGREVSIGDNPMIFYFTGKHEIFKAETILGVVSAAHQPSYEFPSTHGIVVKNEIHINLEFRSPATIQDAVAGVNSLLRFLELIAGRPQNLLRLRFFTPGSADMPTALDVYWSMRQLRDVDGERKPSPGDLPIQAAHDPIRFGKILAAWLSRDNEWRSARSRFSTAFSMQHVFTIDRLVGAANMFDILPASAVPASVPLTHELKEAKEQAVKRFRVLDNSPERNSILGALGRLGRVSLKHKVRARAQLIMNLVPNRFPDLFLILDEAIDCRNFYVHGSEAKIDYEAEFGQVIFLTTALEFTFAASDLIECGWDIEEWSKQGSTLSHPFDAFRLNYESQLADLRRVLAAG